MSSPNFDYIIIGGGTAGVVIASRLSQYLPDARIALLEAGPNAVDHPLVNDVSNPYAFFEMLPVGLTVDYSTVPQPHLNGRKILNPAGRLLSGSSGVNVGTWMRPSTVDCAILAEKAGSKDFEFGNMLKYFKRVETHSDGNANADVHGFEGPVHTIGGRKFPLREKLRESAEKLGHGYEPDAAAKGDQIGLSDYVQCFKATSASTATRQHSAKVYDLSGVEVLCDSHVARILVDEKKRATGIELVSGTKMFAAKEVILSCGTQRTPQVLMLSGIGPADELKKHGIPVVMEAPAVGQNLFDHSAFMQYFKLKDGSKGYAYPYTGVNRPEYAQGMPIDFSLFGNIAKDELTPYLNADGRDVSTTSIMAENRCHYLSLMFYDCFAAPPPLFPSIVLGDGMHVGIATIHMMPLSRGTVTLKSNDPLDNPVCDPRFFSTHTDRFIMRRAIREGLLLAATGPLAEEIEGEVAPLGSVPLTKDSGDEEIDARVRAETMTISHPIGTCALGTVLDSKFRVKGLKGLRVCDASVFPEPIAVMPSCMIYAMAELCADIIAGKT